MPYSTDVLAWAKSSRCAVGGGQSAEKFPSTDSKGYAVVTAKAVKVFGNAALPITAKTVPLTGMDVTVYPARYGAYPSTNVW